jgi:hypothetical protein
MAANHSAFALRSEVRHLGLGCDLEVSKEGARRRRLQPVGSFSVVDFVSMVGLAVGDPQFRQHGDRARCDPVNQHPGLAVRVVGRNDAPNLSHLFLRFSLLDSPISRTKKRSFAAG